MDVLDLRTDLATRLASELGTYTLPNGAETPAIAVRASGENLPADTTASGLEVVIIRDPSLVPIRQYEQPGALPIWTVFLVAWDVSVRLDLIAANILYNYPSAEITTVPVPRGVGAYNQMRVTLAAPSVEVPALFGAGV